MNINFFIDGPQADGSRNATIVGACELQVGVISTLHALRGGHVPYERQRILDGIPQLKHKLMGKPQTIKKEDYNLTNRLFRAYHVVNTTRTVKLTHKDGLSNLGSYSGDFRPNLYCVNLGRINHWRKYNDNHKNMMQIWTCAVEPSTRYVIESLSVRVKDQGWGNTGVNIAFFAVVNGYMMEITSRALLSRERSLASLDLVKDRFNFSRFIFASFLPPGTSEVTLVAIGRLTGAGHSFEYLGHELRLGVLA